MGAGFIILAVVCFIAVVIGLIKDEPNAWAIALVSGLLISIAE